MEKEFFQWIPADPEAMDKTKTQVIKWDSPQTDGSIFTQVFEIDFSSGAWWKNVVETSGSFEIRDKWWKNIKVLVPAHMESCQQFPTPPPTGLPDQSIKQLLAKGLGLPSHLFNDFSIQKMVEMGKWMQYKGISLHSSGRYWYRLDYPDQWPTPHTWDDRELVEHYLTTPATGEKNERNAD